MECTGTFFGRGVFAGIQKPNGSRILEFQRGARGTCFLLRLLKIHPMEQLTAPCQSVDVFDYGRVSFARRPTRFAGNVRRNHYIG